MAVCQMVGKGWKCCVWWPSGGGFGVYDEYGSVVLPVKDHAEIRRLIRNAALTTLLIVHVLISLIGLGSGFVVLWGLINARTFEVWTTVFLITTIATSVTGFFFPAHGVTPGHVIGVLSLIVLAVAVFALYGRKLVGLWRSAYVLSAVTAQYLNSFVLVVQLFLKVPVLRALAPTQTEPVFAFVQFVALAAFVGVGTLAALRSRSGPTLARA